MSTKTSNGGEATAEQILGSGDRNESKKKYINTRANTITQVLTEKTLSMFDGTTRKTVDLKWIKIDR